MFLRKLEELRTEYLRQKKIKKRQLISYISRKIVSSPYKYWIRGIVSIFSESSLARIRFFSKLRYDLYHCMYEMGNPTYLGYRLNLKKFHRAYNGDLILGNHAQIGDECMIDYSGGVVLEDHAYLSDRVVIYSHNHPVSNHRWPGFVPHRVKFSQVRICEHAWVGNGAIIIPDCTYIGKYALVAAGSVVTRDVPEYAIVAGNPARIVGYKEREKRV